MEGRLIDANLLWDPIFGNACKKSKWARKRFQLGFNIEAIIASDQLHIPKQTLPACSRKAGGLNFFRTKNLTDLFTDPLTVVTSGKVPVEENIRNTDQRNDEDQQLHQKDPNLLNKRGIRDDSGIPQLEKHSLFTDPQRNPIIVFFQSFFIDGLVHRKSLAKDRHS
ncbi:MAG: hypothetical protein OSA93_08220 [Akkermansiaceae bacterium]|nr:hypothetical protein [Akkermansiaceae bacterium]